MSMRTKKINTSNPQKFAEFERLFASYNIRLLPTHNDLKEIDADPLTVVVHKASQFEENTLVEDTSLDVDGASVGVHVRCLLANLKEYAGRKAVWTVLLAEQHEGVVYTYQGQIKGMIVLPEDNDEGFGFDPIFVPEGAARPLSQSKPDKYNARALAVAAYMEGQVYRQRQPIKEWLGAWQKD